MLGLLLIIQLGSFSILNAQQAKLNIYCIPGQGADERIFSKLELGEKYLIKHIKFFTPPVNTSLPEYAKILAEQIDNLQPFVLVGASLGGMLAVEMNEFLNPLQTIVISSAKSRNELPGMYRFQRKFPLYRIFPGKLTKIGAQIMQPIVEPERKKEKAIFKGMLKSKDPDFLKRTIVMIMNWERNSYPDHIIHIHGSRDKTIPIRNVDCDFIIEKGSHLITLTRAKTINKILVDILPKEKPIYEHGKSAF